MRLAIVEAELGVTMPTVRDAGDTVEEAKAALKQRVEEVRRDAASYDLNTHATFNKAETNALLTIHKFGSTRSLSFTIGRVV